MRKGDCRLEIFVEAISTSKSTVEGFSPLTSVSIASAHSTCALLSARALSRERKSVQVMLFLSLLLLSTMSAPGESLLLMIKRLAII